MSKSKGGKSTKKQSSMMPMMKAGGDPDGQMALSQIKAMQAYLDRLEQQIEPNSDLEPWVNSKITLADDYLGTAADYMAYGEEGYRQEEGGEEEMKAGGGIPQRYKNMGFTRVGQKKAGDGKHKWKVLAKKGDKYKVVQGGWKGMQDFSQHGSEKRRSNFWNRMGGKNSSKAKDPFSPLYWHKRLGKWEEGGEIPKEDIPDNKGFKALPLQVQQNIVDNMAKGGARIPNNPGFRALPEKVKRKILANMESGGKMPDDYARARFEAAGNEDQLADYGYARYGADIEPFVYNGYNDTRGNWKDPGMKKRWAAMAGMGLYTQSMMDSARAGMGVDANYDEMGGVHSMRPLPGQFYPEGMDMYPLPGKAAAGGTFYELGGVNSMTQPLPGSVDMNGAELQPLAGQFDNSMKDVTPLPGKAKSGIHIKPSKKGTFTAAAKKHGKGVQEFARQVMANKENYSPAMVKKANFARNAAKWNKGQAGLTAFGGPEMEMNYQDMYGMYNMPMNAPATPPLDYIPNVQGFIPDIDINNQFRVDNKIYEPTAQEMAAKEEADRRNMIQGATGLDPKRTLSERDREIQRQYDTDPKYKRQYDRSLKKNNFKLSAMDVVKGLTLADMLIKPDIPEYYYQPSMTPYYNPYPSGTGSRAINMETGGWIGETNAVAYPEESGLMFKAGGQMIKRADGSYSRRGLWDNIRANRGSGKKPTKEMLKQERKIRAKEAEEGMQITNLYYPRGGEIMNVADQANPIARMGGSVRMNYNDMSEYEEGGELSLYDDTQGAQPISDNPYASEMIQFDGERHGERNDIGSEGIPINYSGTDVEVEDGETGFRDQQGNFQILGNMKNPITGRKFKEDGKKLAEAERKAMNKRNQGAKMVDEADPDNPYDSLKLNTGMLKMKGGDQQLEGLADLREAFASTQQAKLDLAAQMGIEPMDLDNKAKMGKMIKAQPGRGLPTITGSNIDYLGTNSIFGQSYVDPFYPMVNKNSSAKPAPSPTVSNSDLYWPSGRRPIPANFKRIPAPAAGTSTGTGTGTGSSSASGRGGVNKTDKKGRASGERKPKLATIEPRERPDIEVKPSRIPTQIKVNTPLTTPDIKLAPWQRREVTETDIEPYNELNNLAEYFAIARNAERPVRAQGYIPRLKQPYQLSLQDQLNMIDDTYKTAEFATRDNPAALANVTAEKVKAKNNVLGQQFNINLATNAQTYNENLGIMNQAQMANLQLFDQQFVRQEQGRANTERRYFDALRSITDKRLADEAAKRAYRIMENMYDFRYDPTGKARYRGSDIFIDDILPNTKSPYAEVDDDGTSTTRQTTTTTKRPGDLPSVQTKITEKEKKMGGSITKLFKNYKY